MDVIDEEGRLFGVVNVVDALVVLFVVALVVAGVGLVAGIGGQSEPVENRSATLVFSSFTEEQIGILTGAENLSLEEAGQVAALRANVTGTHVTPVPGQERATLFVAVQYRGTDPLPVDRRIRVATEEFTFNGTVRRVGGERSLPTTETAVTVEATVPSGRVGAVDAGDRRTIDGQPVATITSVTRLFERDGQTRLLLGLDLQTIQRGETQRFAGRPLRLGTAVPFSTGEYALSGSLVRLGEATVLRQTVRVRANTTLPQSVADAVAEGDRLRLGNESVARVESVQSIPTEDPNQRQLRLGLALRAVTIDGETRFLGRMVRIGQTIPIRTADYDFDAQVIRLGDQPTTSPRPVSVNIDTVVPATVADTVATGDILRVGNRTVGRVQSVQSIPTGNANRQRLQMELRLQAFVIDGETRFLGRPIRVGTTVPVQTDRYGFDGQITSVGQPQGEAVETTVRVAWENVRPDVSDDLRTGMAVQSRGIDARVTGLMTEPATVVLTSETGEIFAREHPVNEDVTLTLSVGARQTESGLIFQGRALQSGRTVVLDFGTVTVDGTVTSVDDG